MPRKLSTSLKLSLVVLGALASAPAATAESTATNASFASAASGPQDFSAARRYRPAKVYVHRPYAYPGYMLGPYDAAPSFGFIGGPDGYPGEYAWRKSLGQCVRDLGYGRWKAC